MHVSCCAFVFLLFRGGSLQFFFLVVVLVVSDDFPWLSWFRVWKTNNPQQPLPVLRILRAGQKTSKSRQKVSKLLLDTSRDTNCPAPFGGLWRCFEMGGNFRQEVEGIVPDLGSLEWFLDFLGSALCLALLSRPSFPCFLNFLIFLLARISLLFCSCCLLFQGFRCSVRCKIPVYFLRLSLCFTKTQEKEGQGIFFNRKSRISRNFRHFLGERVSQIELSGEDEVDMLGSGKTLIVWVNHEVTLTE